MTRFGMGICSQQAWGLEVASVGMSEPLLPALRLLSSPFQLLLHHVWQFLPWPLLCTSDLWEISICDKPTRFLDMRMFFCNVNVKGMCFFVAWVSLGPLGSCSLSSMAQVLAIAISGSHSYFESGPHPQHPTGGIPLDIWRDGSAWL